MLRVVFWVNTVAVNLWNADNFQRPVAGVVVVVLLGAWTAYVLHACADAARRTPVLLGLDLAVAVAALVSSPLLKGEGFQATVPGFWVAGPLLALAVRYGVRGGLLAGAVLAGTDLLVRAEVSQGNYGNVFLLLIGGPVVGYMADSLRRMAAERDRAQREAAAEAERVRLGRAVHDGVLQVLALVQRRGAELGGEGAELGRLAGEQEAALRRLIQAQDAVGPEDRTGIADLTTALAALGSSRVSVATPGAPVELAAHAVEELVAVVRACLDNVRTHVGADAPAWVLLEDVGDRVAISVRDEGPGIPAGRLDQAVAQGRLGVSQSICGRVADLGGSAELSTGAFGTEWEVVVPRGPRVGP
ncbi:histidine kinase [Nocardioides sp. zg-DK7169]|nr:histidine kinase [Nocardioides sp. zg-DK7169]